PHRLGRLLSEPRRVGLRKPSEMGKAESKRRLRDALSRQHCGTRRVEPQVAGELGRTAATMTPKGLLQGALADAGHSNKLGYTNASTDMREDMRLGAMQIAGRGIDHLRLRRDQCRQKQI